VLIEGSLLSAAMKIAGGAAGAVVLGYAALTAPWRAWLDEPERQWVWLGSLAVLVVIWSMQAGITPGLSFRFLLVTMLTLMHGWQLAVIGAALVLVVLSFSGRADWSSFGPSLLCVAIVPALFTARWHELVHAKLPHNYFVYFFLTVFLGSALAFNLAGLARLALLALGGTLDVSHVGSEYLAYLPLMSFGEGVANGMFMAMAVVYRPRWVMSFDDRLYLARRGD
jgi:uncharacterized membrane protein